MNGATENLRPEEDVVLSMREFARTAALTEDEVRELVGYHLLTPERMDLRTALALREAVRLRDDFDLDLFATGLLAGYLLRISELEAQVRQLQAERPARFSYTEVSFTSVQVRGGR
jgi:hypothetical protein